MNMAKLITGHHNGEDLYSDGAVEDELLALFESGGDPAAMLRQDKRWPVLYHLSPERRNLLEWFPFKKDSSLLEVGAGCGALTGLFAERTAKVTAVELSLRRSRIIAARYPKSVNIEVMAGNISDLELGSKYDCVTLVGVLEYARSFVKGPAPARNLLARCASLLAPGGALLVAVENKFGLKYFAGAREDHSGRSFESIEGYRPDSPAETWSRDELEELLESSGFGRLDFYYPYPDYKLPEEVFSDRFLPGVSHVLKNAPNYDCDRYRLFSEKRAMLNIIAEGKFSFFSNSFLVAASGHNGLPAR